MTMNESVDSATTPMIGGKLYAGVIINARPFVEVWPRCICGYLAGKDHHNRGFDNGPIRTSTVQSLLLENGKLFAITLNSAYRLESVDLAAFLNCPGWFDDLDNLITQAVAPKKGVSID